MRREPALFRAIDVSVSLVELTWISEDQIETLLVGLGESLPEADYGNARSNFLQPATLTLVRANAVRLARALKRAGQDHAVIADWISAGANDPVPEVRVVSDSHD